MPFDGFGDPSGGGGTDEFVGRGRTSHSSHLLAALARRSPRPSHDNCIDGRTSPCVRPDGLGKSLPSPSCPSPMSTSPSMIPTKSSQLRSLSGSMSPKQGRNTAGGGINQQLANSPTYGSTSGQHALPPSPRHRFMRRSNSAGAVSTLLQYESVLTGDVSRSHGVQVGAAPLSRPVARTFALSVRQHFSRTC